MDTWKNHVETSKKNTKKFKLSTKEYKKELSFFPNMLEVPSTIPLSIPLNVIPLHKTTPLSPYKSSVEKTLLLVDKCALKSLLAEPPLVEFSVHPIC